MLKRKPGYQENLPGQSETSDRPFSCFDFLPPRFESVDAGSTLHIRRRACAGPTLLLALYEVPGVEMIQMWHLPCRRSQFRGGDRHICDTNRGGEGTYGGARRHQSGDISVGGGRAGITWVLGKRQQGHRLGSRGWLAVSWELKALLEDKG